MTPKWQTEPDLENLCLNTHELHLWWLPLTLNSEQSTLALSLLNERQFDKYHRRATASLQNAYLAGRYYLFSLLSAYLNRPIDDINLSYNRLNKPFLDYSDEQNASRNLQFNFTDTTVNGNNYALFAFCWDKEVGVDLESINRSGDLSKIAKRRFTQDELSFVSNPSGDIDPQKCLAIWTRKEAYGKARGIGINFQMNQRNLINPQDHDGVYNFNDEDNDWRLIQLHPSEDFIACVVHQSHEPLSIKAFNSLKNIP